jgi:hypothetical protein
MQAKKPRYRFIVTENGIATEDDTRRVEYFERALAGLISRDRLTTESMHCFRRRSYATPFVLIEAPCFAPSSPLSRRTNHSLSFRHASAIFLQSGLHPSVHKPDMSVSTGSVFE